jgi:hypothetical protein
MKVAFVAQPSATTHIPEMLRSGAPEVVTGLLLQTLRDHGIVTTDWGRGLAKSRCKSLADLRDEILNQEAQLVEVQPDPADRNGRVQLYRVCSVARVHVRYTDPVTGKASQLYEASQTFVDGGMRVRDNGDFAVWEKLLPGEDPLTGAIRALEEELQLEGPFAITRGEQQQIHRPGLDYPGLPCLLNTFDFTVCLYPEQYRPSYSEVSPQKTTLFKWRQPSAPFVSSYSKKSRDNRR